MLSVERVSCDYVVDHWQFQFSRPLAITRDGDLEIQLQDEVTAGAQAQTADVNVGKLHWQFY